MFSLLESALCLWIQVHPLWIQGLKRLVLWTQNLTLLEDQGLWIQTLVLHLSYTLRLRQVVSEQDLRSNISYSRMSKEKVLSIPQVLFSYTSGYHRIDDGVKCQMVVDFSEFSGQLHIKEFLDWLIEVESFFEDQNIPKRKQVKYVSRKLKGSAWAWWEQLQRMRTRLGKDPIQDWEKMKKYLKRHFLPPDYQDLVYEEYQNCKQLCDSIAVYTKKFCRLQSYLDFNEAEEYSISKYKNGLRWSIKRKLSTESFDSLTDLVLAATHVEQVIEREQTVLTKPQEVLDTTTQGLTYPIVSETPSDWPNSWRNISTSAVTVFTDNDGYSGGVSSKVGMVDFPEAFEDKIDVSVEYTEKEILKESNSHAGCTTQSKVCQHIYDGDSCLNLVAARQLRILGMTTTQQVEQHKMEEIYMDHINYKVTGSCPVKLHHDGKYLDKILCYFIDRKLSQLIFILSWRYDLASYFLTFHKTVTFFRNCQEFVVSLFIDYTSFSKQTQEVVVYHGETYFSDNEAAISLTKKRKANSSINAANAGKVLELITEFPSTIKGVNHPISLTPVLSLANLLESSIIRTEKSNQPRQVYLLPNAFTTKSIIAKSGCLWVKRASVMPQYHENRRFNLIPEIILNNLYQEMCITKEAIVLKSQEFLKTIPKSSIAQLPHYNVSHNLTRMLPGQRENMFGMQLINERISIRALRVLLLHEERQSWAICTGNQADKFIAKSMFPTHWRGIVARSRSYFTLNLKSSYQWISSEEADKYKADISAYARIYHFLDFSMESHNQWMNYHLMGNDMVYLGYLVHAIGIITMEEKISAILNLKTRRNINDEKSYQKHAWFYIQILVTPCPMLTIFINCTIHQENSMTSSFEEGAPDVAQIPAQEPFFL